jgi:uncharacterized membrane protein YdjX (TVP38/TMEM64 family)
MRVVVIAVIFAAASGVLICLPQANDAMIQGLEWIDSLGAWGPFLFVLVYIVGCVLFVPGSLLTIGAGMIFGLLVGTVTVSIGSTLGAGAAFLLARSVVREWVVKATKTMPRFRAVDEAVGREGFNVVLLTRLSPLFPFNLLNFAYGITSVSFRDYFLASWIGMLPGAVLYVYIGTAVTSFAELAGGRKQVGAGQQALFVVGLIATAVLVAIITRMARKSLSQVVAEGHPANET